MAKKQTYGVPYSGSKNKLAEDIIALLPKGKRLVDLFGGGCAITHCALLSGKWESILNNDLYPLRGQTLFRKAAEGEYLKEDYYRIVSKQEFYEKIDIEPHMIAIWGWNFTPYYIGQPFQRFCQENVITDLRQLERMKGIDPHYRQPLSYLKRLRNLAGLDLSKVEFSQMNYADYEHQEGDVVYCDPPYANTHNCYEIKFDTDPFWEWVRTRDYPVYVSEYKAPDDFVSIWSKNRTTMTSPTDSRQGKKDNSMRTEHLFVHQKWLKQAELLITC